MNKAVSRLSVAILPSLLAGQVLANESSDGFHVALKAGLTSGGDKLFNLQYADGDSKNIKAGSLFEVGMGTLYNFPTRPIAAQLTFNYHFDTAPADNGDAGFDRYPLEGIVYYTGVKDWRFGLGGRLVLSPEAEVSIDGGDDVEINFKDATGLVFEIGYRVANEFWINLRAVQEDYEVERFAVNGMDLPLSDDRDVSGNHVGINFILAF